VFPGVDVAGGICYFLWDRDNKGQCLVTEKGGFMHSQTVERPLLEDGMDVFIRQDRAISLLRKMVEVEGGSGVRLPKNRQFAGQVSGQKPFGLRTYFRGEAQASDLRPILVLQSGGKGWTSLDNIPTGHELIDQYKVFTSKSSAEHAGQVDKKGQRMVLSLTGILPPNSVVTETYILLGSFASEYEAQSCYSYVRTKLFRYLIATRSSAQDISRAAYEFVPVQSWDQEWTDEKLYAKYGLTDDEIAHIEATIRQMPPNDDLR
jgi:site-specific DNA-methyltransferase (adenine-specific)